LSDNFDATFDVIVVGGGPAGSAAAIGCAGQGLQTLLLEASPHFSEQPGETMHPGIEPLFRSLGVEAAIERARFLRHPGYIIHSNQRSTFHAYGSDHRGQWLGYQAERTVLHQILLERAATSGAQIRRGERALRPVILGDTIIGVATPSGHYTARYVVDAAGPGQWLRRHLRLPCLHVSTLLVAHYGWVSTHGLMGAIENLPEFFMRDSAWIWTAPVDAGRHAWVTLDLLDRRLKPHQLPSFVSQCPAIGKSGARDVTWRVSTQCAGSGYFMVGDAAWLVDPASSHGVLKSMLSGTVAADAIGKALRNPDHARRVQAGYCAWAEDTFCTDAAALISLYSGMTNAPSWLSAA
jgi:flavin-dependent dehydrogenase